MQDPLTRDLLLRHLIVGDTLGVSAVNTHISPDTPEWVHRLQACINHNARAEKLIFDQAAFQKRIFSK